MTMLSDVGKAKERADLDARVLAIVQGSQSGIGFSEICDVLMLSAGREARRPVEGATQRLRRAGSIKADTKRGWVPVEAKPKAKRDKASVRVLDVEASGAGVGPALAALGKVAGAKRAPAKGKASRVAKAGKASGK